MTLSPTELERFATELAARSDLWEPSVSHSNAARVYEQVWDTEEVNAWVICWSPGQDTGFHDHDDSAAAIFVIDGHVREERLRLGRSPGARLVSSGQTLFVPPTVIHRVLHEGPAPAVTIHAYSPPLRRTGAYSIGPDGALERVAQSYEEELRAELAVS
ncbi:MAG: cysteine dioxygenase family protein [Solirubrobacterales bacterium]|nr:cysteine dioxygenase family protein [Solirubrobacterales bacterium]